MTTSTQPIPICRCPRCGARWVLARERHVDERGSPLYCLACGEEYVWEGGQPVPITRPATASVAREMAREQHARTLETATLRRREAAQ